ncbi:MAG TPA: RagB/SusD family nutrient uptake outer membrane protein [Parasegetibacter sp.]
MKKLLYIFSIIMAGSLVSCDLTNVTDITPPNQLSEETVITDIGSAEKVLIGAYAQLHSFDMLVNQPGITGSMGLSFISGAQGGAAYMQFYENVVSDDNYLLTGIYTNWYYLINICSHIIEKTERLNITVPRKNEIIGEARFLRALGHFNLLRLYGRFYDVSSEYGIVTWDEPVRDITPKPRNAVAESYTRILEDLEQAVANAPQYTSGIYASKQAAMVLRAKVLLYKKDYAAAAQASADAIAQKGGVTLESNFADIFTKWFNSKEVLLAPPFDDKSERNNKAFAFRAYVVPTEELYNMMAGDNRRDVTYFFSGTSLRNGKFQNTTANGQSLTANTEYFLRLAEIYLIQAEALVRSSNGTANFQAARDALNVIRGRVGMPSIGNDVNTKAALLQAVFHEKLMELGAESGEEWFDLVRFHVEGDLDIKTYKPNVVNENRFILPIPAASIIASNNVVKQNPGYE